MTIKHSKKTLALLAQFPGFDDWIINNLTPEQIMAVVSSSFDAVFFGKGHPLNSQELGVQLWRAYKRAVVFEMQYRWGDDSDYFHPPDGCEPLTYFHQSVCNAIGLFVREQPELLDKSVERHRRDIEISADQAQPNRNPSRATERRNQL